MRTVSFDPQLLRKHLLRHKIATLPELKQALGATANLTVFRKLKLLDYLSSYTHRGRYYSLPEIARFDDAGLWSHDAVWFSRAIRSAPAKPLAPFLWWPMPPPFRSPPMNSRLPFCCSTACWMNSSAASSLDWNPSNWATAAIRSWPRFSAWTRTPWLAVASNCSTGMCRWEALAALAADANLSKKNRRHPHSDRIPARLRHRWRSHHRPEVVPSNDGKGCPGARRFRHHCQPQYRRSPAPSDGLFPACQSQEALHRPLPRS